MGSAWPILDHDGEWYAPIGLWTYAKVEVQFERLRTKKPFENEALRREFLERLNAIPGVAIPSDAINRRPSFFLTELQDEQHLNTFLGTLGWFYDRVLEP
jgi:hypothetical protein